MAITEYMQEYIELMDKTCKNCKWWKEKDCYPIDQRYLDEGFKVCSKIWGDGDVEASIFTESMGQTDFITKPTFGCSLWEKE